MNKTNMHLYKHQISSPLKTYLLLICICFSPWAINVYGDQTTAKNPITLNIGVENYPPWSYKEDSKIAGVFPDIMRLICNDIEASAKIHLLPAKRSQNMLNAGKLDIASISAPHQNRSSNNNIIIGENYFFKFILAAFTLKSNNISINSDKDLYNYRIGHIRVREELEKNILPNHPNRHRFNTNKAMLKSLLSNRIDIIYATQPDILSLAQEMNVTSKIKVQLTNATINATYAWSKQGLLSSQPDLNKQLSSSLEKLKQQGLIENTLQKYSKLEYFRDYGEQPPSTVKPHRIP